MICLWWSKAITKKPGAAKAPQDRRECFILKILEAMPRVKRHRTNSNRLETLAAVAAFFLLATLAPQCAQAALPASDTACNDSGNGTQGGSGFAAWSGNIGSGGGIYTTSDSGLGANGCNTAWGIYTGGGAVLTEDKRSFTNSGTLSVGQTVYVDMQNDLPATPPGSGSAEGLSLENSSGNVVWETFFAPGAPNWTNHDNAGYSLTSYPYESESSGVIRILFTLTGPTNYTLKAQSPVGTAVGGTYTGALMNPSGGTSITTVRLFTYNIGSGYNLQFNNLNVSCPDTLKITNSPTAQTACAGNNATFSVSGISGDSVTYQWQTNGVNLSTGSHYGGVTTATLTITNVQSGDAVGYDCMVQDACGDIAISTTNALTVNALASATITAPSSVCTNSTGNAASVPNGGSGVTYGWTISGGAITSSATTNNIAFSAGAASSIMLTCNVTNVSGCISTGTSNVTVSPTSVGGTATATLANLLSGLSPTITLSGYLGTIQWQSSTDGINFNNVSGGSGGTTATYTTPALTQTTFYRAVVTSGACSTANSAVATVTVSTAPSISAGPTNMSVCSGSTAIFAVTASGTPLCYAWYKHANAGWGSAWTATNETGGTTFLGSSTDNNNGAASCNSFGSSGDINTPGGNAWGLYGGTTGEQVTRTFPAALTNGQVFQIDMDNGFVNPGLSVGFSLHNASNIQLLSFYFTGGGSDYVYYDGTGAHTTSVPYTANGLQVTVIVGTGSPASYSLLITSCGGNTVEYSGTFVNTGAPDMVLLYNNNTSGSGANYNLYFNNLYAGLAYDNADNYSGSWSGFDKGDASPIGGATNASYSTSTGNNGELYYAMVDNSVGAAVSGAATLTVNALPSATITKTGSDCQGSTDGFSVPPASGYLWILSGNTSGASFSGGTNGSSITVNNGGTGSYTISVTVTNASGCTSNSSLTVTSVAAPTVSNPSSATVCQGNTTSFTITATGVSTYQWQVNKGSGFVSVTGADGTGGNTASFTTVAATTGMNNYQYECQVTGCGGAQATSTPAILTVSPTSVGGTVAASVSNICNGGSVTLTNTGYTGSIQWQLSSDGVTFTTISGATSATYTTPALTQTKFYRAAVTNNPCSGAYSTTNMVAVSPTSVGGTATATISNLLSGISTTVTLSGFTGTIQWQQSLDNSTWTNVSGGSGGTTVTYTTPALMQTTYYRAVVTSGACSTSNSSVAAVTVVTTPSITSGPTNSAVCSGSSASFTVIASGTSPLGYNWRQRGSGWGASKGWTISNNGAGGYGSFIGSSGKIDSSATTAFGLYANSGGSSDVYRGFGSLEVGQTIQVDIDNNLVDSSGPSVGFGIQNSAGQNLWELYFAGGGTDYTLHDGSGNNVTTIPFTQNGLRITFTLTSATGYSAIIQVLNGGSTYGPFTGALITLGSGTQVPGQLHFWDFNAGSGSVYNFFFNNLYVGGGPGTTSVGLFSDDSASYSSGDSSSGSTWVGGSNLGQGPIASVLPGSTEFSGVNTATLTINPAASGDAANYDVVVTNAYGAARSTPAQLTVNLLPTITLGNNPTVAYGSASASLPYTAVTGSPNLFSITFDPTAHSAGFADVTPMTLTSSPVTITVPANATVGTYNGTLTTLVSTTGCNSSVPFTVTISKASTTNVVSTSANPSPTGSNVTFTATLTAVAPGSGTPTGTVQFLADGTALGSPVTFSGGIASLVTNSLSHGTHVITAQYAGDGNFIGSTNTLNPNQVINSAPVAGSNTLQRYSATGTKGRVTTLLANDTDPDGDTITLSAVAATSAQGGTVAASNGWVFYRPPAGFTNADSFAYVITDGSLQAIGSVAVTIITDTNPASNIELSQDLGNGSFLTDFLGIPGRTYSIQYTTNLTNPDWQTLGTATADASGLFEFTDSPATNSPPRFFRSTYP